MPHPYRPAAVRIPMELVEADFEIAFNLVDLAEGDRTLAARVLAEAETVFLDIETRLARMDARESQPFHPLAGELRREIDLARLHTGEAAA